ncbi:MAG: hypothetical protein Q9204_007362 [Flavoplaca sp. TL-2023a]
MAFFNPCFDPFVWTDFSYDKVYTSRYGDIAPNEQCYQQHKDNYRHQRDAFLADPRALPELEAWRKRDNDYDYQLLYVYLFRQTSHHKPVFTPDEPSNCRTTVGRHSFRKARLDQGVEEYNVHNASHLILSESEHSYIIGNKASYDGRQYPLPPNAKRPEGQDDSYSTAPVKPSTNATPLSSMAKPHDPPNTQITSETPSSPISNACNTTSKS